MCFRDEKMQLSPKQLFLNNILFILYDNLKGNLIAFFLAQDSK